MIPIHHEDIKDLQALGPGLTSIREECFFCKAKTRYWHNHSNTPVCPRCAREWGEGQLGGRKRRNMHPVKFLVQSRDPKGSWTTIEKMDTLRVSSLPAPALGTQLRVTLWGRVVAKTEGYMSWTITDRLVEQDPT